MPSSPFTTFPRRRPRARSLQPDEVLRRVPYLRAAGLFDIFQIAHPALRAMIEDHSRGA
jgi:hypothetical protein